MGIQLKSLLLERIAFAIEVVKNPISSHKDAAIFLIFSLVPTEKSQV